MTDIHHRPDPSTRYGPGSPLAALLGRAFGHDPAYAGPGAAAPRAVARTPGPADVAEDAGGARGVFSVVVRVPLAWRAPTGPDRPASVVVKLPAPDPNGAAAMASGACRREAEAYRSLLPGSPIRVPRCHHIEERPDGWATFVLEDLGPFRAVDQMDGLGDGDALAVAEALARVHRHWESAPGLAASGVRRATPAGIPAAALEAGLVALRQRWAAAVDDVQVTAFEHLLARRDRLVEAFAAAGPPTLCHGDPRADNLVFDPVGAPVLFDWQQIAIQVGAADVAWLAATSLTPAARRRLEPDLLAAGATTIDHYRLGLVLPGMAVLLLAQRVSPDERAERFVATTIGRIATALVDLDVPGL